MSLFKRLFDRRVIMENYGYLCQQAKEQQELENRNRELLEENEDLRARLSAYEPDTPLRRQEAEDDELVTTPQPLPLDGFTFFSEDGDKIVAEPEEEKQAIEDDDEYDIIIDADGTVREKGSKVQPTVVPLYGEREQGSSDNLKAGLS